VDFRAELPKTLVGKVLRRVLVEEEKKKIADAKEAAKG
jgi:long-chain acyl-CoA synthetase